MLSRVCLKKLIDAQLVKKFVHFIDPVFIQGAAERTHLFEKQINSKPKKIRQMFFYFWKEHRMPFYIIVF